MAAEHTESGPGIGGHWYQWRLSTLLLIVLIVALALGGVLTYRTLREAKRQLQSLRNEAGYLAIEKTDLVHVIALEASEPMSWRWRLYLPKGHKYQWKVAHGAIPPDGFPRNAWTCVSNEPYWETGIETLVTVSLRRQGDGAWALTLSSRSGGTRHQLGGGTLRIPDGDLRPMLEATGIEEGRLGSRGTETAKPGEPLLLLKRRACEIIAGGGSQPSTKPMPGIMVWLEKNP